VPRERMENEEVGRRSATDAVIIHERQAACRPA